MGVNVLRQSVEELSPGVDLRTLPLPHPPILPTRDSNYTFCVPPPAGERVKGVKGVDGTLIRSVQQISSVSILMVIGPCIAGGHGPLHGS